MLDLVIRGGTVVDGSGRRLAGPTWPCATGGWWRSVTIDEPAAKVIDADGLLVTPGFVDLHTHYDAQLSWDPTASPSPLHGVTTVIGGNCGFSLAPAGPEHARLPGAHDGAGRGHAPRRAGATGLVVELVRRVAGPARRLRGRQRRVPRGPLGAAPRGDGRGRRRCRPPPTTRCGPWRRCWPARSRKAPSGSPRRRRRPTTTATACRCRRAPPRAPSSRRCARVLSAHPGTTLELIVPGCLNGFSEDEVDLMATLSLLADRPANWNVLGVSALNPGGLEHQLDASTAAAERGATVVALTLAPHHEDAAVLRARRHPRQPAGVARDVRPAGSRAHEGRCRDPAERARLDAGAKSKEAGIIGALARWENLVIDETFAPANAGYEGRSVGDVATGDGQGALRRAARHRGRRQPPDGTAPAHRRVRGRLGAAGQGVAGPAHRGGRVRRRGAPGHDVRGDLLHLDARRRRAGPAPAVVGGGRSAS